MTIATLVGQTDAEILEELRGFREWPTDLNGLAVRAVATGGLRDAAYRAMATALPLAETSSNSSSTIPALIVPTAYSYLPNWENTFYSFLRRELHALLGLPAFDPYEG
jgi:hypothetical protein